MKIKPWRTGACCWKQGGRLGWWQAALITVGSIHRIPSGAREHPQFLLMPLKRAAGEGNCNTVMCCNVPGLGVTCEHRWWLPPKSVHGLWSAVAPWTGWTGVLPLIPSQSSIFGCRWSSRFIHSQDNLWGKSSQDILGVTFWSGFS